MEKSRNLNFDLMKIISMLMIILWHIIIHGKVLENTTGKLHILLIVTLYIIIIHVNSFVLITGYFQHDKKFKVSKLLSINNAMWFYKAMIAIIFISLGLIELSKIEIFRNLMPFNYNDYWFIMIYVFLYLISPLLNIIIKNINMKQHKLILITMFIVVSVLATISNQEIFNNGNGYSLINFIFLYFIGAYISKYEIKFLKNNKFNIILFVIIALLNFYIYYKFTNSNITNFYLDRLKNSIISSQFGYASPIVIIQSIIYFYIFKNIKIKNKILKTISSTTIGIYMIHDNILIRNYMYINIFKIMPNILHTKIILIYITLCTIIIFVVCMVIELIRKFIFKKIYNLKIFKNNREKIRNFLKKHEITY